MSRVQCLFCIGIIQNIEANQKDLTEQLFYKKLD